MTQSIKKLSGVGMGFRRELIPAFKEPGSVPVDFFEIAPENWIGVGGKHKRALQYFMERYSRTGAGLVASLLHSGNQDTGRNSRQGIDVGFFSGKINAHATHSGCTAQGFFNTSGTGPHRSSLR